MKATVDARSRLCVTVESGDKIGWTDDIYEGPDLQIIKTLAKHELDLLKPKTLAADMLKDWK